MADNAVQARLAAKLAGADLAPDETDLLLSLLATPADDEVSGFAMPSPGSELGAPKLQLDRTSASSWSKVLHASQNGILVEGCYKYE